MRVCEGHEAGKETPYRHPEAIKGHLYKLTNGYLSGELFLCVAVSWTGHLRLFSVASGVRFDDTSTFSLPEGYTFEDVTDEYCLKRVAP